MNKTYKIEYIWLDGNKPEPNLRSKTKIITKEVDEKELNKPSFHPNQTLLLRDIPQWNFDGSSTSQASGNFSDCILKPVSLYYDPSRGYDNDKQNYIALCEVYNADGTPHESNHRSKLSFNKADDYFFGFEMEYVFIDNYTKQPVGFPSNGYPEPQGKYYCGVGSGNVAKRAVVEEHLDVCLKAGLNITGINAEVLLGQWEFQLLGKGIPSAADDLWIARYFLYKISEKHGVFVNIEPKPIKGDWNGSGLHTNFSTKKMREVGGKEYFEKIFQLFELRHKEHIEVYGSNNNERLTGKHETCSIDQFRVGVSDRGASIRIPKSTSETWKGYLEDRRPASNANPYQIVQKIVETMDYVDEEVVNPIYVDTKVETKVNTKVNTSQELADILLGDTIIKTKKD